MTIHFTNAGNHRGNVRAWMENSKLLNDHGFAPDTRYRITYAHNAIILNVDPEGPRKVSNTFKGPIIDLNNKNMNHYDFANGIQWSFTDGQIVVTPKAN